MSITLFDQRKTNNSQIIPLTYLNPTPYFLAYEQIFTVQSPGKLMIRIALELAGDPNCRKKNSQQRYLEKSISTDNAQQMYLLKYLLLPQ